MQEYLNPLKAIKDTGNTRGDRTGTGTKSLFGLRMEFDLNVGLPLLTSKKVFTRGLIEELCWFIAGNTNNESLVAAGVHIWDEWALPEDEYVEVNRSPVELVAALAAKLEKTPQEALEMLQAAEIEDHGKPVDPVRAWGGHRILREHGIVLTKQAVAFPKGDLGPVYGKQWRKWRTADGRVIDQLADLIDGLKTRPWSRRHAISAWNVGDLPDETISPQENVRNGKMALSPCHAFFQFYVEDFTVEKYMEMLKKQGYAEQVTLLAAAQSTKNDEEMQALVDVIAAEIRQPVRRLSCQLYQR